MTARRPKLLASTRRLGWRQAWFVALPLAAIGTVVIITIFASGTPIGFEAESGAVSIASKQTVSGASGGSAIKFGSAPTPTSTPAGGATNFCNTFPALPSSKPDATNTGVPAGTTLTASGSITVTTAGTVINAKNVTGTIAVNANNVTIENSKLLVTGYFGITIGDGVTGTKIIDNEVYTTAGGYIGITGSNATICGNYVHGLENGMTLTSGNIVQANYITKLLSNQTAPHYDGIEDYYGGNNQFWGNNIMTTDPSGAWLDETSALNITATGTNIDNVIVNGNWFGGGSYTVYVDEQNGQATNIKFTGNHWYRNSYQYGTDLIRDRTSVTAWTGNVFDDNGQAVAGP